MTNLIPIEEKKKINRDFHFRLITVLFAMFGFCMLLASIAILPSYFVSSSKKNFTLSKLETQKNEPVLELDANTSIMINDFNQKLSLIENAEKNKFILSKRVINEIILKKMSNIKITDMSYSNDAILGKTISIDGTAPNREMLLSFKKALANDTFFSKVDLPISNFVKGKNIEFSLTLIPS